MLKHVCCFCWWILRGRREKEKEQQKEAKDKAKREAAEKKAQDKAKLKEEQQNRTLAMKILSKVSPKLSQVEAVPLQDKNAKMVPSWCISDMEKCKKELKAIMKHVNDAVHSNQDLACVLQ